MLDRVDKETMPDVYNNKKTQQQANVIVLQQDTVKKGVSF